ncbi:hypothetical protein FRC10_003327 [Ceratobasidium sp. 414]|nr:hypothetical protein FRC10_003327 [Ceratobasidium sp. 414]
MRPRALEHLPLSRLERVVASSIRPPSPVLLMRSGHPHLSSSSSGHSARSSVESTASISSLTPLTPNFHADLEKHSFSSEDNLRDAIAQDLAILQPVEEHYHRQRPWWLFSMICPARTGFIAQASLANLTLAVVIRNEFVLAALYYLISKFPFRRFYAHRMLHSIGGLHVGCALAAFGWIILYVAEVGLEADLSSTLHITLLTTALILPVGLTVLIGFSLRPIRERYHNAWEYTHRYVGWFVIADLVIHLSLKSCTLSSPLDLFNTSLPYFAIISTTSVFYIWFTVRHARVSIRANRSVAVITFPGKPTMRSGTFARISRDGYEWHAFSVAMTDFEKKEFSLIVARAGDWTTRLISDVLDRRGPGRMWIRGVQAPGFMYMHRAYKKVVTVCTGAGIAPALPHIEQATSDIMLIWIAKVCVFYLALFSGFDPAFHLCYWYQKRRSLNPNSPRNPNSYTPHPADPQNHRHTYGEAVWKAVTTNLPANQLILHDTGESGRPDIGSLIERAAKAHDAEAVFVVKILMTSRSSKREKLRRFLDDTGYTVKDLFRSRSPAPPAPGADPPDAQPPAPTPADSVTVIPPGTPGRQAQQVDASVGIPPQRQLATRRPTPMRPSTAEPLTTTATQPPPSLPAIGLPQLSVEDQDIPSPGPPAVGPSHSAVIAVPVPQPGPSLNPSSSALRTKDVTATALKTSLDAFKKTMNGIPIFKSVADILVDCIDNIPLAAENHKDYKDLASNIAATVTQLEEHLAGVNPARMTQAVANVIGELNQQADYIKEKQRRTRAGRYIGAEQDIDDLIRCYRRIEALFRQLQSTRLGGLDPAKMARYDSFAASQLRRGGCTPNTRKLVLQGLQDWASDPHGAKIYWMNGMAGTGKTTIAHSFCTSLKAAHQLAASFFCSRSLPECRNVARIAPTIAYQLARFCRPFQAVLCRILGDDPDIGTCDVKTQFEKLVSEPLLEVKDKVPSGLLVVVIDALDECSDGVDPALFLGALLHFAKDLPIKFFVTCRPERGLLEQVWSGEASRSLYHLHDIEQSMVRADIETYLQIELGPVNARADHIRRLAEQSGKLFIYAATAVRYIRAKNPAVDPQKRLDVMLGVTSSPSSKAYEPLDALYTAILAGALEDEELEVSEKGNIELVLHTVVCARESLTIEALACLLQFGNSGQVQRAIEPLRSVLHVDERTGLVSTLHASFPNYMHTAARSGRFFCDEATHGKLLAQRCFEMMERSLRFNICSLGSSFVLDKEVSDLPNRIHDEIPLHLFYACRYWSSHLLVASDGDVLHPNLTGFLHHQVLYWTEVLNLKESTRAGVTMLSETFAWLKGTDAPDEICAICQDAQKFISVVGANPVCKSTPHIYISVLALWDKRDPIWTHYGTRMQGLVKTEGSAIDDRDSAALAVWRTHSGVGSIAISSNGRRVASGHGDGSLCIWDAHNGDILAGPLKGHTGWVNSIAFSPDCSRVVSGSNDPTIRTWDTQTGQAVASPFEGHTNVVLSVAYSPDGNRVVSGSADKTIRIWDARTGCALANPFKGHTGSVFSVAYSSDGSRIVSGSHDHTIRIWDTQTGHTLVGPLKRHTSMVMTVAFSPDGRFIASGSGDSTVCIWDAFTGHPLADPFDGHTGTVRDIAYSPDGSLLVSASNDHTVRIWDTHTGKTVTGPLRGHAGSVYSAIFMPDGTRVVSGSVDHTIRVWDARSGQMRSDLLDGHVGEVISVGFSHDSSQIVSGSSDRTICIWDAKTGSKKAGPFRGHTGNVYSVAFSPNGDYVASCSEDCTIRVWDAQTGSTISDPFKGHKREVCSVAFSPDGSCIVSGSLDRRIRVWDVQAGSTRVGPLKRHTGAVFSVAYSPGGDRIASGSSDCTIRVWDAQTGTMCAGPFEGHDSAIYSVVYSPDNNFIASCSENRTVRIWDVHTGETVVGPLTAHSDTIFSIAYSPDGHRIAFISRDGSIGVLDAKTGKTLAGPFKAHTGWVRSVTFSPDGRFIASGSNDGAIRVWDSKLGASATSPDLDTWMVDEDGWVVGRDSCRLLWVPSDLRVGLKWPQNVSVIHCLGHFQLDFTGALIGPRWAECYRSH